MNEPAPAAADLKPWMALIEVEAEGVIQQGTDPLSYNDPRGRFRVQLKNRAVRPLVDKPLLEMQMQVFAVTLETAEAQVEPLAREFLYWLSLVSHCAFRIVRVERLIDWSPGLTVREQYIYHQDRTAMPLPTLRPRLLETIGIFNKSEPPPEVAKAIRWFANGLSAQLADDKFQCFFFAIEILAQYHKPTERVPDVCPKCRRELYCRSCEEIPTHRPYAKQAIEKLLGAVLPPAEVAPHFALLMDVRHKVMHGAHKEEIERGIGCRFNEAVDRAGELAWRCILTSMTFPADTKVAVNSANKFVRPTVTIAVRAQMGTLGGDPNHPRIEDQGTLEIVLQPGGFGDPKTSGQDPKVVFRVSDEE